MSTSSELMMIAAQRFRNQFAIVENRFWTATNMGPTISMNQDTGMIFLGPIDADGTNFASELLAIGGETFGVTLMSGLKVSQQLCLEAFTESSQRVEDDIYRFYLSILYTFFAEKFKSYPDTYLSVHVLYRAGLADNGTNEYFDALLDSNDPSERARLCATQLLTPLQLIAMLKSQRRLRRSLWTSRLIL